MKINDEILNLLRSKELAEIEKGISLANNLGFDVSDFFQKISFIKQASLVKNNSAQWDFIDTKRYHWSINIFDLNILNLYYLNNLKTIQLCFPDFNDEKFTGLDIPKEILAFDNITAIQFEGRIRKIPEIIFKIKSIEKLQLQNNDLKEIPKEIVNLKKLKYLDLRRNQVEKIPDFISELEELEKFDFRKNPAAENITSENLSLKISLKIYDLPNIKHFTPSLFSIKQIINIKKNNSAANIAPSGNSLL